MSTEQFELQLHAEKPAVQFLNDSIADFLLNRGHAAKIGEIVSQVGKRIGANAKLIRQTMTDNTQFVGEDRRWNLSSRVLFHRPLEGALEDTLRLFGRPLTISAFSNEMAVLNARPPEFYQQMLPRFLRQRQQAFFPTPDGRWALREWLLDTNALDEEELLLRNFFDGVGAMEPLLEQVRQVPLTSEMSYLDAAHALLSAVALPLDTRVMAYALWRLHGAEFEAQQFYLDLLSDARFHLLSGGQWVLTEQISRVPASLQQLSQLADVALEEEDQWEGPYVVGDEDLREIEDYLVEHGRPQKISDLIEAVFEYSPTSPRYPAVHSSLMEALQADPRFQLVGQQTWTLPMLIPQEVLQVPESLLPEALDPTLLTDPETDAELEDEGLDGTLALWVHDPRYEDFGGEHEVELSAELLGQTLEETRIPLLYNHRKMGTLKLRQSDMSFFPTETPLACITVHTEEFPSFQFWINNDELLVHGLADWYEAKAIPIGATLIMRRGAEPDDYVLSYDGEVDELIALTPERVAALLDLREQAEAQHWSVYDIMAHVLAGQPDGAHFLRIWAEANVVRRTPKRVVASNLSSYHCFSMITGTERWKLDERKVEQGRKKTKKKFVIE